MSADRRLVDAGLAESPTQIVERLRLALPGADPASCRSNRIS
ncbi:MAG: hypothetical protein ACK5H2_04065 [Beutenbergiaceae bacterium]